MPEIRMNGARISYSDQGQGDVLVLLHGWIGSGALWSMVAPWLSERFRIIVPDLPGHGDSGIPDGFQFTLAGFTAWLEDLCLALELPRVSLVGHSMGGSICMNYAASHADEVDRLVLIAAPARANALGWTARVPLIHRIVGLLYPFIWGPRMDAHLIKSSVLYPEDLPPTFLEEAVAQGSKVKKEALVGTTRMLAELYLDPKLPGVKAPTLIIYGDQDPSVKPAEAKRLQGLLPDAQPAARPRLRPLPQLRVPRPGGGVYRSIHARRYIIEPEEVRA
jgi:pimeloyl-ACP methyl ester carboxylesterase